MPLRVVAQGDGSFEVVDGFRRLACIEERGDVEAAIVLEEPCDAAEAKALVLRANAPPRTVTAMDEARVIGSLLDDDGLTATAAARLLGRRKSWVARRHALLVRLGPEAQSALDHKTIGPTLAYALTAVAVPDQAALLGSAQRHSLKDGEAQVLVSAFRAAATPGERTALLADPFAVVRPGNNTLSPLGPLATRLEAKLESIRAALKDLASFALPATELSDAERRRLEAHYRSVVTLAVETTRALSEGAPQPSPVPKEVRHEPTQDISPSPDADDEVDAESRPSEQSPAGFGGGAPEDRRASPTRLRPAEDSDGSSARPQDGAPGPSGAGAPRGGRATGSARGPDRGQQARPFSRGHHRES
jgi:ParB-like chromosome segregation protein Spo0J